MDNKILIPKPQDCGVHPDSPLLEKWWPKSITVSHSPSNKKSRDAAKAIAKKFPVLDEAAAVLLKGIDDGVAGQDQTLPGDVSAVIENINATLAKKFSGQP